MALSAHVEMVSLEMHTLNVLDSKVADQILSVHRAKHVSTVNVVHHANAVFLPCAKF